MLHVFETNDFNGDHDKSIDNYDSDDEDNDQWCSRWEQLETLEQLWCPTCMQVQYHANHFKSGQICFECFSPLVFSCHSMMITPSILGHKTWEVHICPTGPPLESFLPCIMNFREIILTSMRQRLDLSYWQQRCSQKRPMTYDNHACHPPAKSL